MRHWLLSLVILVFSPLALAQRPSAMTARAEMPLEIVAYRSDLIVLGKVVSHDVPRPLSLPIPGDISSTQGLYTKYRVQVLEIIHLRAGEPAITQPATGPATQPADQPTVIDVYARFVDQPLVPKPNIQLQNGSSYLLMLYRAPRKRYYYLPDNSKNRYLATSENLQRIKRAADVDHWNWGAPAAGLRLALLTSPTAVVPRRDALYLRASLALKNVSDSPIAVDLAPENRPFGITAQGPADRRVEDVFYDRPRKLAPGSLPRITLDPGEVAFVGPTGKSDYGFAFEMPLTPGAWRLTARMHAPADPSKGNLWSGDLASNSAMVEVTAVGEPDGSPPAQ